MYTENCLAKGGLKEAKAWRVWDDYELKTVNSREEAEKIMPEFNK